MFENQKNFTQKGAKNVIYSGDLADVKKLEMQKVLATSLLIKASIYKPTR